MKRALLTSETQFNNLSTITMSNYYSLPIFFPFVFRFKMFHFLPHPISSLSFQDVSRTNSSIIANVIMFRAKKETKYESNSHKALTSLRLRITSLHSLYPCLIFTQTKAVNVHYYNLLCFYLLFQFSAKVELDPCSGKDNVTYNVVQIALHKP